MSVTSAVLRAIARRMGIPELAIRMFDTASSMSGLDKHTLPVELLPLNTIQLSRGLLNYTVLQTLDGWVFPYWAEQQYNPLSASFIPRSHLGVSMNITHRNWTAVGNADCEVEPIIDPRGLATLSPDGWSVDTWLRVSGQTVFPSRMPGVTQTLHEGLPIVVTSFRHGGILVRSTAYTSGARFIQTIVLTNQTDETVDTTLGLAVRPFNPEGVALVEQISAPSGNNAMLVNQEATLHFSLPANGFLLSNRNGGDTAHLFAADGETLPREITCPFGLANGVAVYRVRVEPQREWSITAWHDAGPVGSLSLPSVSDVAARWHSRLEQAFHCELPDQPLLSVYEASHASLLSTVDATTVKPGPATYHYFWFRDAAYMLLALDRLGHTDLTRPVINAYTDWQERSGMFRSQQGEWDSTGQAIWSVWQHAVLAHDQTVLAELFGPLTRGVRWIAATRDTTSSDPRVAGLMPRGLSAEHLGLADVYYWDSFWSLAGVEAYCRVCRWTGKEDELRSAEALATSLRTAINTSIAATTAARARGVIPAGPLRGIDAGMIGSVAPWYPLQLFPPDDGRMLKTQQTIADTMFLNGLFYQPIVHSGLNVYLTLQMAQTYLYAGDAEQFWRVLTTVAAKASPTCTYPEAIHLITGGGAMGDGHHGWASAEITLAVRNAFVLEQWNTPADRHSITFLAGIPREIFARGESFGARRVRTPEGTVDIAVATHQSVTAVEIAYRQAGFVSPGVWSLSLPVEAGSVRIDGAGPGPSCTVGKRRVIQIPTRSMRITFAMEKAPA